MKHDPIPGKLELFGVTIKSNYDRKPHTVARVTNLVYTKEARQATAARLVECWNACYGIAQPIAAIETARVAIRQASAELLAELENDPEAIGLRRALSDLNAAAVLFGMEPETLPADPDEEGGEA